MRDLDFVLEIVKPLFGGNSSQPILKEDSMSASLWKTSITFVSLASFVSTQAHLPDRLKRSEDVSETPLILLNEDKTPRCKMNFRPGEAVSQNFSDSVVGHFSIEGLRECDEDDILYTQMFDSDSSIEQAGVGSRVFMGLAALALAAGNAILAACVVTETPPSDDALASPEYGGYNYSSWGSGGSFSFSFNDVPSGDRVDVFTDAACTRAVGSATSEGELLTFVEIPSLAAGTHSFYARAYRGESASACSLVLENYEIEQDIGLEVSDDVALEEELGPADASGLGAGDAHGDDDQEAQEAATPAL